MATAFEAEIAEQPEVARRVLADRAAAVDVAERLRRLRPPAVLLAGRGSSHNAALYGRYLLEVRWGVPVSIAAPSVYTLYESRPRVAGLCAIGISQSGRSPDVAEVVAAARAAGAFTVAITNDEASELATAADVTLPCLAGPERSVPASKTYFATLLRLAQLAEALQPSADLAGALQAVPGVIVEALEAARRQSGRLAEALSAPPLVVGRGYQLATASEAALKITETSGLAAQPFSPADLLHGPIAAVVGDRPALLLEPEDRTLPGVRALAATLRRRGARLLHVAEQPVAERGEPELVLPRAPHETLSPLTFAPAAQLLALALALARGLDPDRPAGLSKVTVTR